MFTGVTGLAKGAQFALFTFLAVVLPVEIYGFFGLLYAYQTAVMTFAGSGIGEKTAGQLKDFPDEGGRRSLFERNSGLFAVTGFFSLLVIGTLGFFTVVDELGQGRFALLPALMLGLVLSYGNLQGSLLRLHERYAASLGATAGVLSCSIVGMALGAWLLSGLTSIFSLGLITASAGLFLLGACGGVYFGIPRLNALGGELASVILFTVIALFGWLSGYGINTFINLMLEIDNVAAFTFLLTVSSLSQMVASAMNSVWVPRFYAIYNAGLYEEAERKNRIFYITQAFVLGGVGLVALLCLSWMGVYSEKVAFYSRNSWELYLLLAAYIFIVPCNHVQPYYLVCGMGKKLMQCLSVGSAAGFVVWLSAIYFLGSAGVYLGFFMNGTVKSIFIWNMASRKWKLSPVWLPCIVSSALMLLAVFF